mgnify:CR=1 FL=1
MGENAKLIHLILGITQVSCSRSLGQTTETIFLPFGIISSRCVIVLPPGLTSNLTSMKHFYLKIDMKLSTCFLQPFYLPPRNNQIWSEIIFSQWHIMFWFVHVIFSTSEINIKSRHRCNIFLLLTIYVSDVFQMEHWIRLSSYNLLRSFAYLTFRLTAVPVCWGFWSFSMF